MLFRSVSQSRYTLPFCCAMYRVICEKKKENKIANFFYNTIPSVKSWLVAVVLSKIYHLRSLMIKPYHDHCNASLIRFAVVLVSYPPLSSVYSLFLWLTFATIVSQYSKADSLPSSVVARHALCESLLIVEAGNFRSASLSRIVCSDTYMIKAIKKIKKKIGWFLGGTGEHDVPTQKDLYFGLYPSSPKPRNKGKNPLQDPLPQASGLYLVFVRFPVAMCWGL